jgi:hypothetical protein
MAPGSLLSVANMRMSCQSHKRINLGSFCTITSPGAGVAISDEGCPSSILQSRAPFSFSKEGVSYLSTLHTSCLQSEVAHKCGESCLLIVSLQTCRSNNFNTFNVNDFRRLYRAAPSNRACCYHIATGKHLNNGKD